MQFPPISLPWQFTFYATWCTRKPIWRVASVNPTRVLSVSHLPEFQNIDKYSCPDSCRQTVQSRTWTRNRTAGSICFQSVWLACSNYLAPSSCIHRYNACTCACIFVKYRSHQPHGNNPFGANASARQTTCLTLHNFLFSIG